MTAEPSTGRSLDAPVVDTAYGPVRGMDDGTVKSWRGVRYARPPVGELRWRAPQPPEPWTDVADATRVGPACPQPTDPRIPLDLGAPQGEDSLVLNVWASSGTEPGAGKPVMVWAHGGAYVLGSAAQSLYRGRALARGGDALIVTVNYRLGAFGFLDLSSFSTQRTRFESNLGLRDVLFALEWVRDNIAAFGGDPARVTLFGESAGAGIVTTLLASPAAAGLFSSAIAQSSPATSVYDARRSAGMARQYLDTLGVGVDDVDRLASAPLSELLAASKRLFDEVPVRTPGTLAYAPIVDGDVVPDYPVAVARAGGTHPVPLIIGTNKHEAALFRFMKSPLMPITPMAIKAMFEGIAAEQPDLRLPSEAQLGSAYRGRGKTPGMGVARDIGFRMPTIWFAEGHGAVAPVYTYRFDWATPMLRLLRLGAAHATELPYVWGNLVAGSKDPTFKLGGLKTGTAVSERIRARWLAFAATGEPTGLTGEPRWRPYRREDRATLMIDRRDTVVVDPDEPLRAAWGDDVLSFR
ncbi:carboxylic ester hydrolase [Mycolicibacterium madagascariense]|uniref:Carboxylic ester hydrolase n=1 Tax=Mycolicibacterium madagascariense TaxID=212765 RepID=A0A7I7XHU0_9MYCO|nr:carboxylesterase/lipase family protein [Mycolicibacterium madagascariense]MCV7014574.1 carboxylesterase/lipase family protein [Mycolicibacterium madagascariense]BBZ28776.1 carboxylic ester hydrolase [Mycolicibacterium madagascariense]